MRTCLPWCLLGFFLVASGCRSTAMPRPTVASTMAAEEALREAWRPVTFVDSADLQSGAGAMDAGAAPEFSTTGSGLKYRILRNSNRQKPTVDSTVTVNYRGWLSNGNVFDSSYERGEPTTFPLRNVVAGWTEGMQLVGEGGMIELYVPSRLGYGERGSPGSIPAHSNLHFIVELVSID